MRVVLQRVVQARVEVEGKVVGAIGRGLLVYLGIARGDTEADADWLLAKISSLRVFHDENGKMNRDVREVGGGLLIISQFTLYGDCSRGRRPSFDSAAPIEEARRLYDYFVGEAVKTGLPVAAGVFQAHMNVHSDNDGPVTLICNSPERS